MIKPYIILSAFLIPISLLLSCSEAQQKRPPHVLFIAVDDLRPELACYGNKIINQQQPFFLGVDFFKPHLRFNAPKKYWDLYQESELPLALSPDIPGNMNPASLHNSSEFNGYHLGEEKASLNHHLSDEYFRKLMHTYCASVSYLDAQIGKVLDELERLELAENIRIKVWGDHGSHLGDHRVWGKHTVFERALRSAFIVKLLGKKCRGQSFDEIVSTVDIHPTFSSRLDHHYKIKEPVKNHLHDSHLN